MNGTNGKVAPISETYGDWTVTEIDGGKMLQVRRYGGLVFNVAVCSAADAFTDADQIHMLTDALYDVRKRIMDRVEQAAHPYYGKALRVTVKQGTPLEIAQKWMRLLNVRSDLLQCLRSALTDGEYTETGYKRIDTLMHHLAENPGHPFDVFICDAADMPEWEGFDGDEVGE